MKTITTISLLIFCLLSSFFLQGQSDYILKATGNIPEEFISSSTEKYQKEVDNLKRKKGRESRKKQKDQKTFLLESGFAIDDILQSGLVLFNDPVTNYVNQVLEQLPLEEENLINKNPRAYVLKSPAVNAFATDQGIIFVTLGLLAQLENEAQLAFILSHELIHVREKHAINQFIYSKDIDRNNKKGDENISKIDVDKTVFKKSLYSRQLEEEADECGLKIFSQTDYDPQAVLNIFKILHYSYLPFQELDFERSFFEDEHYIFPPSRWLNVVNPISPMEVEKEDERSTHPSSSQRFEKLKSSIQLETQDKKNAFVVSKREFQKVQTLARYQLPFLYLNSEDFPLAIYTSYLLLQNDPYNLALQKVIGKSLYMEAKYQNHDAKNGHPRRKIIKEISAEVEGTSQQIYHLLSEMTAKEITVLATKYNWKLHQQHSTDEELSLLMEDLFIEFANTFSSLQVFSKTKAFNHSKRISPQKTEDTNNFQKKDKVNHQKYNYLHTYNPNDSLKIDERHTMTQDSGYWQYAFVEELKNSSFISQYQEGLTQSKNRLEKEKYFDSPEGQQVYLKRKAREKKKGKKLGIKKIVVVNPFYLFINNILKGGSIQYIRSEKKQTYFAKAIDDIAKMTKIDAQVLDVTNLSPQEIEKFNDITEINDYFSQQIQHDALSLTPGYNQQEVNKIAAKYDTPYFLLTGVIALREGEGKDWEDFVNSLAAPLLLPFQIFDSFLPNADLFYYAILFDVRTGRRSIIKMDYFNKKDSKSILRSHIYDVFHQISSSEEKD